MAEESKTPPTAAPIAEAKKGVKALDRDIKLAKLDQEKKLSCIKAWEENEKSKALNKAEKKRADVDAWEKKRTANLESKLREMEEQLEKKKAEYAEKMKNKIAQVHQQVEEKKADVQAKKGEQILTVEENAAKFRVVGHTPKSFLGCV